LYIKSFITNKNKIYQIIKEIRMMESTKPNKLCHYTGVAALMGIVDSGAIWATQSLYLNDYKEINHGAELLRDLLYPYEISEDPKILEFFEIFDSFVNQIDGHGQRVYIASFSTKDNQLSQWRGYAPSNKGVSLTFNLDMIFRLVDETSDMSLIPCLYDADDIVKNIIDEKLNIFYNRFIKTIDKDTESQKEFRLEVFQSFLKIFASIKTSDFSEEDEWRLIIIKEPHYSGEYLEFREGKAMLVPCLKVPLKPKAGERLFSQVLAGPSQPHNLLQSALSQFNRKRNFTSSLASSHISYRDW
jgi:hypothetical protein